MNSLITQAVSNLQQTTFLYGKGGLLDGVTVSGTAYLTDIAYNARGQRTDVWFGNGSKTRYEYDTDTFRLTRLLTTRNSGSDVLQDITYIYDPEGNIVQQTDAAQQTFYFSNSVVAPTGLYEYDALYRLTKAEGRELTSLGMATDTDFVNNLAVPNPATNAMQNYTQLFTYDELGNIQAMQSQGRWTRNYIYDTATNRLLRHEGTTDVYTYDAHGNMTAMPHLSSVAWSYSDLLHSATNGTFTSYYNYNAGGTRMRKVVEKGNIREERVYLGNYELYRKYVNNTLTTERQTLHITDDQHRFALIDTLTVDNGTTLSTPVVALRYQYDNHLGSASLELDQNAAIISYEEYHPFGTTSYRSGRTETEVAQKRYKYVGKERDEETGLYYYGARYYAAWLCRFVSVDPLQFKYPHYTPYQYAGNKPVSYIDLDGLEPAEKDNNFGRAILFTNESIANETLSQTDNTQWNVEAVGNLNDIDKLLNDYTGAGADPKVVFISTHGFINRIALQGESINTDIVPTIDSSISPQTIEEYLQYKEYLAKDDPESKSKIEDILGEDDGSDKRMNKILNFDALEKLESIASKISKGGVIIFGSCFSGSNVRNEDMLLINSLGKLFKNRLNVVLTKETLRTAGPYLNYTIEEGLIGAGWQIRTTEGKIIEKNNYSLILEKDKNKNPFSWKKN